MCKKANGSQDPRYQYILYNWLIWRVLKLAFYFKKVFFLYLFWRPEHSEQRHLYVDIFYAIFNLALMGIRQKTPNKKPRQINQLYSTCSARTSC